MDNCQLPKGYKNTEVGVIPEDWEVKPLVEISHIATGTTPPTNNKNNYGEDYFFVSPADLGKGKYIVDTEKKLSKLGFSIARKYPANSILFTCIGSTIGKAGIAKIELTSNQQINAVFPNESYSSDFLFYYLNFISPKIKLGASEQAVPMINKTEFGKTFITLPTKSEQTAIATALSDADALINSLSTLIAKKRNIKQGAMQRLIVNGELLMVNEEYVKVKLGDVCEFSSGTAHENFIDDKGDYIVVNSKFISTDGEVRKYSKTLFCPAKNNDILIVLSDVPNGKAIAKCFFVEKENTYTVNQRIGIVKPQNIDSKYLFYLLNRHKDLLAFDDGAKQTNLRNQDVLNLQLTINNSPLKQAAIAECLSDIDAEIQALETKLEKYRKIKLGMMQNLLTGKIRLIDN